MKNRVLLTGVGGSIGCHTLAHIFHNTDWDVVGIDSFNDKGLTDRVYVVMKEHPEWKARLKIYTHDLKAPFAPQLIEEIGPIDYVISMASRSDVDVSIEDPSNFIKDNVAIGINVLEYARIAKPKVFIQISTDEVYGAAGEDSAHKEWSPILPSNPYAASKAAQEAVAISYWRTYGVPVVITNTMNNFGEMQQSAKFPAKVQRQVSNGEVVLIHGKTNGDANEFGSRFYLHSRNFADALIFILNMKPYLHQDGHIDQPDRYNIVGDRRINNFELAKMIAEFVGKPLVYEVVDFHSQRPGHDRHYALDGSKLKDLGWKSPTSFEEALKKTVEWTKEHPSWL